MGSHERPHYTRRVVVFLLMPFLLLVAIVGFLSARETKPCATYPLGTDPAQVCLGDTFGIKEKADTITYGRYVKIWAIVHAVPPHSS